MTSYMFEHFCLFQLPSWYNKFSYFANYIAYSNSAFNPIIYTGFNENFKKGEFIFPELHIFT